MLKPTLQLKLGQSLTMTPQLQQAIRLLQLSVIDLRTDMQEALDSNPLLEVVERLLARANRPAIIAITTDTREQSIQAIEEAGVDAVVKMPFRPDELRASVTEAIAQRGTD